MKFTPRKLRNEAELKKVRDTLNEQLAAAGEISNPTDRLEAMLKLGREAEYRAGSIHRAILDRAYKVEGTGIFGGAVSLVGASLALSVFVTPLVGIPLFIAGLVGGMIGLVKADPMGRLINRMKQELSGHFTAIDGAKAAAGKDVDNLLQTSTAEIASSEKFDSLCDRYPSIRGSFLKAFHEAIALKELPPPMPKASGLKLTL